MTSLRESSLLPNEQCFPDPADEAGGFQRVFNEVELTEVELNAPDRFTREDGDVIQSGGAGRRCSALQIVAGARAHYTQGLTRAQRRRSIVILYVLYCVICLILTLILLIATIWEELAPRHEVHVWRRSLHPWEESCEVFVGAALCTETFMVFTMLGFEVFFQDCWRVYDAVIAGLTVLCGTFFLFRRTFHGTGEMAEDIDVPMLFLRFALQPVRMVSTATMVVRAHRLNCISQSDLQEPLPLPTIDPRRHVALLNSVLSAKLASQLREALPAHLRFREWELAYSPRVHGTSMRTFYRQQSGPNIVVMRDADGGIFGGFATAGWHPASGTYGTAESFIFSTQVAGDEDVEPDDDAMDIYKPLTPTNPCSPQSSPCEAEVVDGTGTADREEGDSVSQPLTSSSSRASATLQPPELSLKFFYATGGRGRVLQWADEKMFGLGEAVVVCDDFLRGSSKTCSTFGSPCLSSHGTDFIIRDFECWRVGGGGL